MFQSKPLILIPILLLTALFGTALASSVVEGKPKSAEVVTASLVDAKKNNWEITVRLLEHPRVQESGFYQASRYKRGLVIALNVEDSKEKFKVGDKIHVRWVSYSSMGPNGPVGGLRWEICEQVIKKKG